MADNIPDSIDSSKSIDVQMLSVTALNPPYTVIENVDLSLDDVTFAGKIICELRCVDAGDIKVDTTDSIGKILHSDDFDIFRPKLVKIYKVGTDAALWTNKITVLGFKDV